MALWSSGLRFFAESSNSTGCRHRGMKATSQVERVLLNAFGNGTREAQTLHFATNRCGDCTQTGNELGENFRRKRLVAVALGLFGDHFVEMYERVFVPLTWREA